MKKVWITVDIEEWYHLEYIRKYIKDKGDFRIVPKLNDFLDDLDRLNIKATFFTLMDVAEDNPNLIRRIVTSGHVVGCHGYDHDLLYNKSNDIFIKQLYIAKKSIEDITGTDILGYRASCYSMEDEKLDILINCGFKFDSSYIRFEKHDLYRNLKLDGFSRYESLVYSKFDFCEYEIPTVKIFRYNIPISGGGYIRLFPMWLLKKLLKRYQKSEDNFLLYVHPFELTDVDIPISNKLSLKDNFRMNIGRKGNRKKIVRLLEYLQENGVEFCTMS
ncbi:MAG TPA: DUF3473 domain-containing protein [Desulfotomaculum sp.]|nr:MAG: hypothetical protein JL56_15720 [Desulfotomaculum sp. BICA1-6]HBX22990.1 DUF3473 domain-containing protein [Desulfotomaculum sp.]